MQLTQTQDIVSSIKNIIEKSKEKIDSYPPKKIDGEWYLDDAKNILYREANMDQLRHYLSNYHEVYSEGLSEITDIIIDYFELDIRKNILKLSRDYFIDSIKSEANLQVTVAQKQWITKYYENLITGLPDHNLLQEAYQELEKSEEKCRELEEEIRKLKQ